MILQSQLTLGDYFKEYLYTSEIAKDMTSLIGWLNNHGKVRKIFDSAQAQISQDQTGDCTILAYLSANVTWWTTHCVGFIQLIQVAPALKLTVMQH
jgi:hypothetical protein